MKFLIFLTLAMFACKSGKTGKVNHSETAKAFVPQYVPGPRTLVYQTRADYRNLVPVFLSEDKTSIVSYPHPSDLQGDSGLAVPLPLHKSYLLDRRGIGTNVAFLKLSYAEYAAMKEAPLLEELNAMILDKDPLISLCDCGVKTAFSDEEKQLNELIDQGKLESICKKLK